MPTTYSDQFFVIDPGNPPGFGSALTFQRYSYVDEDNDGFIGTSSGDTFNGDLVTRVWVNDSIRMNVPGVGNVTIVGVTFYVENQPAVFTPTDGTILQNGTFISSNYVLSSTQVDVGVLSPTCFTPGTLIETISGPCPVEQISKGDLIRTADHGYQPVVWVARCKVPARGRYAPVRIARGALGNIRDLIVSPQHRILVEGWAAELYSGQDAVLVPARHLVDGKQVHILEGGMVDYIHLGFDRHVLVLSDGIWSESHFSSAEARDEAESLFPGHLTGTRLVRPAAQKHESKLIAASVLS